MSTQFKLCQNGVKIVLTNFAFYTNDTERFLAVLRNKLNHTRKCIRAKQTDDIKNDWRERPNFRRVNITEFLSTHISSNELISCLPAHVQVLVVEEKQSAKHAIVRSSNEHCLRWLLHPDKTPKYPLLYLMWFRCR